MKKQQPNPPPVEKMPVQPLPQQGGSFMRLPDGSLVPAREEN